MFGPNPTPTTRSSTTMDSASPLLEFSDRERSSPTGCWTTSNAMSADATTAEPWLNLTANTSNIPISGTRSPRSGSIGLT
jgi:hypothetical protein